MPIGKHLHATAAEPGAAKIEQRVIRPILRSPCFRLIGVTVHKPFVREFAVTAKETKSILQLVSQCLIEVHASAPD